MLTPFFYLRYHLNAQTVREDIQPVFDLRVRSTPLIDKLNERLLNMKAIKFFFITLLLLLIPFRVYAVSPQISSSTFEVIESGVNDLNTRGLSDYGVFPILIDTVTDIISDYLPIPARLESSDFTIRPLTDVEKEDINDGFTMHFYNTNGEEIDINDLYYVYGNNGYYRASFYMDEDGNVLFSDPDHTNTLLTLGLDNFDTPIADSGNSYYSWQDVYSGLAERIKENNYNYYPTNQEFVDNTYFIRFGYADGGGNPIRTGYVYVPNQAVLGLIIPLNTNGHIQSWVTNDPSLITLVFDSGQAMQNQLTVQEGDYSIDGVNYRYFVRLNSNFGGGRTDVSFSDFLSGNYQVSNIRAFTFENNSYIYGEQIFNSAGVFRRQQLSEVPSISPDEYYDYDELKLTVPDVQPSIDPSYDPNSPISPDNYPITYPNNLPVLVPDVGPYPGISPSIDPNPLPSGDIVTINPEDIPDYIPFIDNLERRFPFSIPWDIKRLLNGLREDAVPPRFEISWYIRPFDYTWEFAIDLSQFSDVAMVFRTCFLISFIIGLAIFSYNHFFGS